jgi:hypothetical protein
MKTIDETRWVVGACQGDRFTFREYLWYQEPGLVCGFGFQSPNDRALPETKQFLKKRLRDPSETEIVTAGIDKFVSPQAFGVNLNIQGSIDYEGRDAADGLRACFGSDLERFKESGWAQADCGRDKFGRLYRLWLRLEDCFCHAPLLSPGFDNGAVIGGTPIADTSTWAIIDRRGGIVGGRRCTRKNYFLSIFQIRLALAVPNASGENDWRIYFE